MSASEAFLDAYRAGVRARAKIFSVAASRAFAEFGAASVLQPPIRITGEDRISIGRDVFVGSDSWLDVPEPGEGIAMSIGDGTSISGHCVLSALSSLRIGRKVLMARNVYISDHNHAFDDTGRPIIDQGASQPSPVQIGDGAWLGENVIVCPGVTVGKGAVVGANAVVLSDVPAHSVAVGVPARVVRTLPGEAE